MKKLLVSLIIGIVFILNMTFASAAQAPLFDTHKLDTGIVAISYNAQTDNKLKVMVEKSGKKVTYDLKNDGTTENFPLQMGDGEYKVSVLENIAGTKYKFISSEQVSLSLNNDNQVYLASVQNINWNYEMAAIKKAAELTKGLKTDTEKIGAIYQYLISNVTYDYDKLATLRNDYVPNIDNIIASGKGICYDYSSVFAAMLRSQGIPAKLVKGYTPSVNGYHAWNEIYNSETGKWTVVDTTYDAEMKSSKMKYSMEKSTAKYSKVYEY